MVSYGLGGYLFIWVGVWMRMGDPHAATLSFGLLVVERISTPEAALLYDG